MNRFSSLRLPGVFIDLPKSIWSQEVGFLLTSSDLIERAVGKIKEEVTIDQEIRLFQEHFSDITEVIRDTIVSEFFLDSIEGRLQVKYLVSEKLRYYFPTIEFDVDTSEGMVNILITDERAKI